MFNAALVELSASEKNAIHYIRLLSKPSRAARDRAEKRRRTNSTLSIAGLISGCAVGFERSLVNYPSPNNRFALRTTSQINAET